MHLGCLGNPNVPISPMYKRWKRSDCITEWRKGADSNTTWAAEFSLTVLDHLSCRKAGYETGNSTRGEGERGTYQYFWWGCAAQAFKSSPNFGPNCRHWFPYILYFRPDKIRITTIRPTPRLQHNPYFTYLLLWSLQNDDPRQQTRSKLKPGFHIMVSNVKIVSVA